MGAETQLQETTAEAQEVQAVQRTAQVAAKQTQQKHAASGIDSDYIWGYKKMHVLSHRAGNDNSCSVDCRLLLCVLGTLLPASDALRSFRSTTHALRWRLWSASCSQRHRGRMREVVATE